MARTLVLFVSKGIPIDPDAIARRIRSVHLRPEILAYDGSIAAWQAGRSLPPVLSSRPLCRHPELASGDLTLFAPQIGEARKDIEKGPRYDRIVLAIICRDPPPGVVDLATIEGGKLVAVP